MVGNTNSHARVVCASRIVGALLVWTLFVIVPVVGGHQAARRTAAEDQVRAAFLFQLAQHVNWPETPAASEASAGRLRFCVYADEAMHQSLQQIITGKSIQGHAVEVMEAEKAEQLTGCHLAFVGLQGERELEKFFKAWDGVEGVLLVGEAEGFAARGGMVNLRIAGGRVSFEINLRSVQRGGLEIRSQLLRFAMLVDQDKGRRR